MGRYASNTSVSTDKSRAELEKTLTRYGAGGYSYGWHDREDCRVEVIQFNAQDRLVRFTLNMPSPHDEEFMFTPTGKERSESNAQKSWEQACRQRWRALVLAVKAKLECVEVGITEFEDEFLAHIVDPSTKLTMGETIRPQIEQRYAGIGDPVSLLGLPSPGEDK